jgi:hypothetical protein
MSEFSTFAPSRRYFESLLAAKALVAKDGSVEVAEEALKTLKKLQ